MIFWSYSEDLTAGDDEPPPVPVTVASDDAVESLDRSLAKYDDEEEANETPGDEVENLDDLEENNNDEKNEDKNEDDDKKDDEEEEDDKKEDDEEEKKDDDDEEKKDEEEAKDW